MAADIICPQVYNLVPYTVYSDTIRIGVLAEYAARSGYISSVQFSASDNITTVSKTTTRRTAYQPSLWDGGKDTHEYVFDLNATLDLDTLNDGWIKVSGLVTTSDGKTKQLIEQYYYNNTANSLDGQSGLIYVDSTLGDDANTGSFAEPVETIARGIELSQEFDVIKLAAGTYHWSDFGTSPALGTGWITLEGLSDGTVATITGNGSTNDGPGGFNRHKHYCIGTGVYLNEARLTIAGGDTDGEWWLNGVECYNDTALGGPLSVPNLGLNPARYANWYQTNVTWHTLAEPNTGPKLSRGSKCYDMTSDGFMKTSRVKNCLFYNSRFWDTIQAGGSHGDMMQFNEDSYDTSEQIAVQGVRSNDTEFQFLITSNQSFATVSGFLLENVLHDNTGVSPGNEGEGNVTNTIVNNPIDNWIWRHVTLLSQSLVIDPTEVQGDWEIHNCILGKVNPEAGTNQAQLLANDFINFDSVLFSGVEYTDLVGQNYLTGWPTFTNQNYGAQDPHILDYTLTGSSPGKGYGRLLSGIPNAGWVGPDIDIGAWFNVTTNDFTFYIPDETSFPAGTHITPAPETAVFFGDAPAVTVEAVLNFEYLAGEVSFRAFSPPIEGVSALVNVTDLDPSTIDGRLIAPDASVSLSQIPTLNTVDLRSSVPTVAIENVYDGGPTVGDPATSRFDTPITLITALVSDPSFILDPEKNKEYEIEWSYRIRPFSTRSRWVDWEGYEQYKSLVVPELEAKGWLAPSFYTRYNLDQINLAKAETPMTMVAFGNLSGDTDDIYNAGTYYRDLYQAITTPNIAYTPNISIHVQPVSLNSTTVYTSDGTGLTSHYWGWEPWASNGTGVNTGPSGMLSPDMTGINNLYSGVYPRLTATGISPYHYTCFSFIIASGAEWTSEVSGWDSCRKPLAFADVKYDGSQYHNWAQGTRDISSHEACFAVPPAFEKFKDIARVHQSGDVGVYHDTMGHWGRGCSAKSHVYKTGTTGEICKHPRGEFTHYYNTQQAKWLGAWTTIQEDNTFRQSAEYPSDVNLQFATNLLDREPVGPVVNVYFTKTGSSEQRTDLGESTYFNSEYAVAKIAPPKWLQRCPAFSIVYGDRAIQSNWDVPDISNAMNISGVAYSLGEKTGDIYGVSLHAPQTHEHRELDWASWAGLSWQSLGRVSANYQSPDYQDINTQWEVAEESVASGLFETQWSGYAANYISRFLRVQGYEPDYIYHGSIQHKLTDWTTPQIEDNTVTRIVKVSSSPNLESPGSTGRGEDAVLHLVKKHRQNNSFLITLYNWHSGQHNFSGVFDPAAYGLGGSYRVYSLDVTGSSHGTKTLLSVQSPNEPYYIVQDFDKYDFLVLELQNVVITSDPQFTNLTVDNTSVIYNYGATSLDTSSITLSYNYETECAYTVENIHAGYDAASTQSILNNLPQWMKLRQKTDSTGWKLANSWGDNFEDVLKQATERVLDTKLVTADPSCKNSTYYFDIDIKELTEKREFNNLLFNSSFAVRDVARTKAPAGWTVLGDASLLDFSLEGSRSIQCNKVVTIKQSQNLDNQLVDTLTASVYVLSDTEEVDITLSVTAETITGKILTEQGSITSRSRYWKRLVVSLPVNTQVYNLSFVLKVDTNGETKVCAPMIEISNTVSKWTRSSLDNLSYVNGSSRLGLINAISDKGTKVPIFPVAREQDFLNIKIPTRLRKLPNVHTEGDLYLTKSTGRKVTFFNEVLLTEWTILDNQIVERGNTTTVWDIYGRYDLRDIRYFDNVRLGTIDDCEVSTTLLACAVKHDWLFVVVSEEYKGKILYTLKIVRPVVPPDGKTYLESVVDFELNLNLDTTYGFSQVFEETVTSIAFSETDSNKLVINTSANKSHYFNLCFDYYYYKTTNNRVYTLESYKGSKIQVT